MAVLLDICDMYSSNVVLEHVIIILCTSKLNTITVIIVLTLNIKDFN